MVKRPFTARALTVIPSAKFAFVIITPTLVYQMNHFSVLLLTLTGFPLMIIFLLDKMFRNTVHIFFCSFSSDVYSWFSLKQILRFILGGSLTWGEYQQYQYLFHLQEDKCVVVSQGNHT